MQTTLPLASGGRMHRPADTSPRPTGRPLLGLLAAAALTAGLPACSGSAPRPSGDPLLLRAGAARLPRASALAGAARLARRGALAYARGAYRRRAPRLPAETAAVAAALRGAAARVPRARRRLHPRLAGLRLRPLGPSSLAAELWIADGRFALFSVALTVARERGRWRITAISLPG